MLSVAFKAVNGLVPLYLRKLLHVHTPAWPLRSSSQLLLHVAKAKLKIRSDRVCGGSSKPMIKEQLTTSNKIFPLSWTFEITKNIFFFLFLGCFECAMKIKPTLTFFQIGKWRKNWKYSCFRWSHASDCVIHGDKQFSPVHWFVFVPRVLRKKIKRLDGWDGRGRSGRRVGSGDEASG